MITIRRADKNDLDRIMELMREAAEFIEDSTWFVEDDRHYVSKRMEDRGFVLKACDAEKIVGFFIADFPGRESWNLGYDLGFPESWLDRTAHVDYVVVSGEARGRRLQQRFLKEAETLLFQSGYLYLLATVHPKNLYSRRNFLAAGYEEAKKMRKYGGLPRVIMKKILGEEEEYNGTKI